jgi:hypothetical protein
LATPLYRPHSAALAATYADVENHASAQGPAVVGTPGAISVRSNASGSRFYVRQYRDFDGSKRDQYIAGPVGSETADRLANEWRALLDEARGVRDAVRLLAREGYSTFAPKHFAALAALANEGLFAAGAILVGTHAFEIIANRMGIRAAAFPTEDIDMARREKLAFDSAPADGLLGILRNSGIDFVPVPALDRNGRSTSFKERGRSRFTFDLLVPTSKEEIGVQPVPELKAHGTSLPYFRYLLSETQSGAALSNHGVALARVPVPERFALHKMIVAQLRTGRPEKSLKDLKQAAALVAALGELHPGALESAYDKTPVSSRKYIRASLERIRKDLEPHPRAWEALASTAGRNHSGLKPVSL